MAVLSPMMKQYCDIKTKYPDTVLMFRLGDFYEMFFEDAKTVSRELELVLTGKECGLEERAPMCGIPYHAADSYIAKLVSRGYKVAVCEQLEDPAAAKGIIKRDVTRILTPGTVIESSMLDESNNNYLCCIFYKDNTIGLCFSDISTGKILCTDIFNGDIFKKLFSEIGRFSPKEIIINNEFASFNSEIISIKRNFSCNVEIIDDDFVTDSISVNFLNSLLADNEINFSVIKDKAVIMSAVCSSLKYLKNVQRSDKLYFSDIEYYSEDSYMNMSSNTLKNLEVLSTITSNSTRGSLYGVLNKAKTSMGRRKLKQWLEHPLLSVGKITQRHNAVNELYANAGLLEEIREVLSDCQDIERLIRRASFGNANAKDLKALENTLRKVPALKSSISKLNGRLLEDISGSFFNFDELCNLIGNAIVEEPPYKVREGGMVKNGFNSELDELRNLLSNGKGYLSDIQIREQERTGIKKLKIGYNRVFGYYIEVLNTFKELVPDDYIRKQTLVNCERYITQELKDLESKVLGAQERIYSLEFEIFNKIREKAVERLDDIQATADAIAVLDVLCSLAKVAYDNSYVKPEINSSGYIRIKNGRHPVVEQMINEPFVPNDTFLDNKKDKCALITGPNMAGKSTYMRQVALISLLTQIGSFVPAESADMCIVDGIFTRIGASDDLSSGSSTFMVEMSEVADILKTATSNSLIIFDEIGRGTSTYDGMSIAKSVLEYTVNPKKLGSKTLFATHYHELTDLENTVDGVKNYHISAKKRGDDLIFLRKILKGRADGSYGIDVAKIAGVPDYVINRAKNILKELEIDGFSYHHVNNVYEDDQVSFQSENTKLLINDLTNIDLDTLTPIEALSTLYDLKKKVSNITI